MILQILIALLLTRYNFAGDYIGVLVTFTTRFWQSEISEFLTSNASCSVDPKDFVWRSNHAAVAIPTDFGIVRIPADEAAYEKFKKCVHDRVHHVKRVEIDGSPYSRNLQSVSRLDQSKFYYSDTGSSSKDASLSEYYKGGFNIVRPPNTVEQKNGRRKLQNNPKNFMPASVSTKMNKMGYLGQGVNVAIFDSGLNDHHSHFKNVRLRSNWTSDNTVDDMVGHGSFVAGVVAGQFPECPGIAPESNIFIFRVFSTVQQSYTSWFLDAFNYALHLDIDVINFSIGGPDYSDSPFTDKINELSANGIIVISAVGEDFISFTFNVIIFNLTLFERFVI